MKKCIWLILCIFIATGISSAVLALNRIDYRQQEECSLCGNESGSILALYSDTNGITIRYLRQKSFQFLSNHLVLYK